MTLRIGILGSGSGTNFQALVDAIRAGRLAVEPACVLSDVKDAFILERARAAGVPAWHVDCAPYRTKLDGEAEERTIRLLTDHHVDVVCLAGFMRMVKGRLLAAFPHRIVNIHPSLLPAFPGLEAWRQAVDYGVKVSGCTVHFVDAGMDTGPIILQKTVPVFDHDTPRSLHARIQQQEHQAYPEALQRIADGVRIVEGRRVIFDRG